MSAKTLLVFGHTLAQELAKTGWGGIGGGTLAESARAIDPRLAAAGGNIRQALAP